MLPQNLPVYPCASDASGTHPAKGRHSQSRPYLVLPWLLWVFAAHVEQAEVVDRVLVACLRGPFEVPRRCGGVGHEEAVIPSHAIDGFWETLGRRDETHWETDGDTELF